MTTPTDAWESLHRAQITLTRSFRQRPEFNGVTFGEYDVLHILSLAGDHGLRLKELNEHVPLTQSSLSRMIDRLDGRGYVHKWQDPDDARGLRIRLTDNGHTIHDRITTRHQAHVTELMNLTPEELTTLTHLTNKLRTKKD